MTVLMHAPPMHRLLRPTWYFEYDDDRIYPTGPRGAQLGTVAEKGRAQEEPCPASEKRFSPEVDMVFIDNYVFERCDNPDVRIRWVQQDWLPDTFDAIQNVAIDASALSMQEGTDDDDDVWAKKLRLILPSFHGLRRITVLATVVLDIPRPTGYPEAVALIGIGNVAARDRARLGILEGVKDPRGGGFALQAWFDLQRAWPAWRARRASANAPELRIAAAVYFKREWVSLAGEGGPGGPCELADTGLDATGMMLRKAARVYATEKKREGREKAVVARGAESFEEKAGRPSMLVLLSSSLRSTAVSMSLRLSRRVDERSAPRLGRMIRGETW